MLYYGIFSCGCKITKRIANNTHTLSIFAISTSILGSILDESGILITFAKNRVTVYD